LWDEAPGEETLRQLAALQKPDGGFALPKRPISTIMDTAHVLEWCDDLKLHGTPMAQAACRFLLERQQPDGGWDEVEAILAHNPPEWLTPGRIATRTWLSADAAYVLVRHGHSDCESLRRATRFLVAHQEESGRIEGYQRATWMALPTLGVHPGNESQPFLRALAWSQATYSCEWEGSLIAWLLRCLQDAGIPGEHPLVAAALAVLQAKQRASGGWESEDGEARAADAAVEALRVLRGYGCIPSVRQR